MGKKHQHPYRRLFISLIFAVAMLAAGMFWVAPMDLQMVVHRLLLPLLRLLLFISIGLVIGQVIEVFGWTRSMAVMARPMFRFGNLNERCGSAFTTAFFSGVAANAMLMGFYKDNKICKEELYLTNFINQLPAYFLHLPTTLFIVLPLTGLAGGFYFIITFLAVVMRTVVFMLYGHFRSSIQTCGPVSGKQKSSTEKTDVQKGLWEQIKIKFPKRIINIVVYVIPIYIFVFVVHAKGLFTAAQHWLGNYVIVSFIPVESLSLVVLSFVAEFTSGFAAAGALLAAGILTTKQTVLALLMGNIVAFPIRALRHQLPRYVGIFSPKMGIQILLMGQGFRVLSIIVMGTVYYYAF
jgi:hypothetical protein